MDALPTAEQATGWFDLIERWGLPLVMLFIGFAVLCIIARVLWNFLKPNIQAAFDDHKQLVKQLGESVGIIVDSIQVGTAADKQTHNKLEEIHDDVKVLVSRVNK